MTKKNEQPQQHVIYVWGTGKLLDDVLNNYIDVDGIAGFIDTDIEKTGIILYGKKVIAPYKLKNMQYDAIVVATVYADSVIKQCQRLQLDTTKLIHTVNTCITDDRNEDFQFVSDMLGREVATELAAKRVVMNNFNVGYGNYRLIHADNCVTEDNARWGFAKEILSDYVRERTVELCSKEILERNIKGEIAEVGVFRGEMAARLNVLFPDRKLYLFDSFEGFKKDEAQAELAAGNCSQDFVDIYSDTSVDLVMKKMKHPENVELYKGFFPESLNGLEQIFAFVSIDVDFEQSIYDSLVYFYPRLVQGGYIFIHDYNGNVFAETSPLKGVKCAVNRYEQALNISLPKVPICDIGRTLVLTK